MKWKTSYTVVAAICAVLLAWFIVRGVFLPHKAAEAESPISQKSQAGKIPIVQTKLVQQSLQNYTTTLRGRTEARRTVSVRSETAGSVIATPVAQGTLVQAGTVLCQLAVDSRQASLDQARAALKSRSLSRQASRELASKGFRSETQVLGDQANYDAAAAAVRAAEVELGKTRIRAPFSGVFDRRETEVGGYLAPGQSCGTVVELNPVLVVADVSEESLRDVHVGATASGKLSTGEFISGRVRFVSRTADAATRTYRVEVEAANPGNRIGSGLSVDLKISGNSGPAHLVPASALVLDAAGQQGVRFVGPDKKVGFSQVTLISEQPDGVWVKGLNGAVQLITVGQSYVGEGQQVQVGTK
jgi:multidrug efflux system membrane fusion protein